MFQIDYLIIDFYDLLTKQQIEKHENKNSVKDNHNHHKHDGRNSAMTLLTPMNRVHQYHVQQTQNDVVKFDSVSRVRTIWFHQDHYY